METTIKSLWYLFATWGLCGPGRRRNHSALFTYDFLAVVPVERSGRLRRFPQTDVKKIAEQIMAF